MAHTHRWGRLAGLYLLPLLLTGTAVLGACHTGYQEGKTAVAEGRTTEITSGNEYLCERLQIRDLRKKRDANQVLTIEFELINTWSNKLKFNSAIVWFDANGMRMEEGPREKLALAHREAHTYRFTAPSPKAVRWKLDLQNR